MKNKQNIPLNLIEKVNSRIGLVCSVVVLVLLVFFFNRLDYTLIQKPAEEAKKAEEQKKKEAEDAANTAEVTTASVIAVGDNLYHESLIYYGQTDSGSWNYDAVYENVKDEIQAADVALVDQETVFTTDHSAVSGYPTFATPTEVGDALVNAGFDVIESATNHIDDYGETYISQTLEYWNTSHPEIPVLGIHDSEETADAVKVLEVNGIKISFLDYTYGTNSMSSDGSDYYAVDIFNKEKIASRIKKAKEASDCLIFVAHWGKEGEAMPTEYEKEWAAFLMEQGVDVLIGGHPHILQPYGRLSDDDGHNMLVFYSLGNFVSTQESLTGLLEGMASFTIQKTVQNGNTTIEILDETVKPMVMHYNKETNVFGPYMLEDYTEDLASQHGMRTSLGEDSFTLANLQAKFNEIMSMNVTPSTNTDLLDTYLDSEMNLVDADGNYVEDTWSVTAEQYLAGETSSVSSSDTDSSGSDSSDSSYYSDYSDSSYYSDYSDSSYYSDYSSSDYSSDSSY